MSRVAPAESDILCESCGYTLNGLPQTGNCPECGERIATSTIDDGRRLPSWELADAHFIRAFFRTSFDILFHPTRFYRTLATRGEIAPSKRFANIHWAVIALTVGASAYIHIAYLSGVFVGTRWADVVGFTMFSIATWIALELTTRLAARLTAWEAAYRGYRMPVAAVRRGLYYHAPHYTPIAILLLLTVLSYYYIRWSWSFRWGWSLADQLFFYYLLALCAEIVIGAAYLFWTYWIAMRNMMYANR